MKISVLTTASLQLNILVKDDGSACLADFGLISIVLDPGTTDITTSTDGGTQGTYRWMAPELFYPSDFNLPKFHLTRESDCYAFAMIIYEVGGSKYWRTCLSPTRIGPLGEDPP